MSEISLKKAALINAVAKYSSIVLNLVFSAVLARILTPEDFGIVAVTTVFTTFFSLLADMGIGSGVIQNKDLNDEDIASIFSFTVRLAFVLGLAFAVFSFPMSWFYKDSVYVPIGGLLAVSLLFSTLNIVPNALLLKQKKFMTVGIRTVILCVFSGTVGIVFALAGLRYYALVLQAVLNSIFSFLWNYVSTHPRLAFRIKGDSIKKIRNYSSFIFGFNIINYFARNSDNLLISKFLGTVPLGYYDKAYKLMLYPVNNLTHVITPILHPILSEHQNNRDYIYATYMKIVKILSLLGAFIMVFCFFNAEEIIGIMFGGKWLTAAPCFKLMSIAIWAQMVTSSSGSIFQSLGDSKRLFISGTINSLLTICAIVLGLVEGSIESIARNVGIIYIFHFILTYIILIHFSFERSFFSFIGKLVPDLMIIAILFASGLLFEQFASKLLSLQSTITRLGMAFVWFSVVYALLMLLFRQWKYFKVLVRRK